MNNLPRYSEQEINIIKANVANNPTNISQAIYKSLDDIKNQLNITRTYNGVVFKYNSSIKKQEKLFNINGNNEEAKNVKNTPSIRFYKNNPLKLNIVINLAQELTNNEKEQLILTLFRTI